MHKRSIYLVILLALILVLTGCNANTENVESKLPYTLHIERADQSVFDGPGYDYVFVDTVREQGTYTIVEEAEDEEGNVWGKLKSGIGWVDLTQMQSADYDSALISANYADETLLLHGDYHHYANDVEYAIPVAFRAYGKLQDVALFEIVFDNEGELPGQNIFTLSELTEEMPLVAELGFPGDMSSYGIRFTDTSGETYCYQIYISGRNGALILTEYVAQPFSYTIYVPNDNADELNKETVHTETISADGVLSELKARTVLPDDVAINSFRIENGFITIDFNEAFANVVCSMGTSGEAMIVGSVVNTFLDAFRAESLYFTVDGQILESGHVVYDFVHGAAMDET